MNLLSILLQAPAAGGASNYSGIIMMVLIFVVFYFFMIRPQSKKQKEIKKQRDEMKQGDHVVTSGGIYGKIKEIKETTFVVEIAENVRIKIDKNSVFASADAAQTDVK
jgi:preprotein translocase subunit YajC